jgi:hypothetical protein
MGVPAGGCDLVTPGGVFPARGLVTLEGCDLPAGCDLGEPGGGRDRPAGCDRESAESA